jgi:hypothetical protein
LSRRTSISRRLLAAENALDRHQSRDRLAFTLDDGRTVHLHIDAVLDVFLSRQVPAVVRRITATTETAGLARSLVDVARDIRGEA